MRRALGSTARSHVTGGQAPSSPRAVASSRSALSKVGCVFCIVGVKATHPWEDDEPLLENEDTSRVDDKSDSDHEAATLVLKVSERNEETHNGETEIMPRNPSLVCSTESQEYLKDQLSMNSPTDVKDIHTMTQPRSLGKEECFASTSHTLAPTLLPTIYAEVPTNVSADTAVSTRSTDDGDKQLMSSDYLSQRRKQLDRHRLNLKATIDAMRANQGSFLLSYQEESQHKAPWPAETTNNAVSKPTTKERHGSYLVSYRKEGESVISCLSSDQTLPVSTSSGNSWVSHPDSPQSVSSSVKDRIQTFENKIKRALLPDETKTSEADDRSRYIASEITVDITTKCASEDCEVKHQRSKSKETIRPEELITEVIEKFGKEDDWDLVVSAQIPIFYSGGLTHGNLPHGMGSIKFENDDTYTGEFNNGQMHGHGLYAWSNGSIYKGEFINNMQHGHGEYKLEGERRYVGNFEKGLIHGYGEAYQADGKLYYKGQWEYGERAHNCVPFSLEEKDSDDLSLSMESLSIEPILARDGSSTCSSDFHGVSMYASPPPSSRAAQAPVISEYESKYCQEMPCRSHASVTSTSVASCTTIESGGSRESRTNQGDGSAYLSRGNSIHLAIKRLHKRIDLLNTEMEAQITQQESKNAWGVI